MNRIEQLNCARVALRSREAETREVLAELLADGEHRIERGLRFLRHKGDLGAEQLAPARFGNADQRLAAEVKRSAADPESARQHLRNGAGNH